jgi:hypothetical protein
MKISDYYKKEGELIYLLEAEKSKNLQCKIDSYLEEFRKKKKTSSPNFLKRLNLIKLAVLNK